MSYSIGEEMGQNNSLRTWLWHASPGKKAGFSHFYSLLIPRLGNVLWGWLNVSTIDPAWTEAPAPGSCVIAMDGVQELP